MTTIFTEIENLVLGNYMRTPAGKKMQLGDAPATEHCNDFVRAFRAALNARLAADGRNSVADADKTLHQESLKYDSSLELKDVTNTLNRVFANVMRNMSLAKAGFTGRAKLNTKSNMLIH
jgi:hypothetical protein